MCNFCVAPMSIGYKVIAPSGASFSICPNCSSQKSYEDLNNTINKNEFDVLKENFIVKKLDLKPDDKVTVLEYKEDKKNGDTVYNAYYDLSSSTAVRLLGYSLFPREFNAIIKSGHTDTEFLLHEDFYSGNIAWQPVSDKYYRDGLKAFSKELKSEINLLSSQKAYIDEYLREMKKMDKELNKEFGE